MKRGTERLDRGPGAALLLAVGLLLLGGQPRVGAQTREIVVTLDSPDPFTPTHGTVTIEAVVGSDEPISRVSFLVDGVVVAELDEPPWTVEVDVGPENREHRYRVVAIGASGATGSGFVSTPSFRVDEEVSITLQQLYVTVTDPSGRRRLDLDRDDFAVFAEGDEQRLVTFSGGDVPFTAVVLLDTSLSMEGPKLDAALEGARTFFGGMRPLDEGRLLVFSDRILHGTPFSTFPEVLTAGLSGVRATGGTALHDHLYLSLQRLESRQGRRVIVLLSDGVDSHSVLSMTDVLRNARRSQALLYWLQLPYRDGGDGELPGIASAWRDAEEHEREFELLRRSVEETGGRVQLLRSLDEIGPAFAGILSELREQYVLGFYPDRPRHDGSWRRLKVRVRGDGLDVRCREGYVDY